MTREEAIKILTHIRNGKSDLMLMDALDMAIKALEQEPSGDLISRQKALLSLTGEDLPKDRDKYIALVNKRIKALPPAKQEPKTDVLDKIRAEIMDFEEELFHRPNTDYTDYAAVRHCVEIIDKYKSESEE